MRYIYFLIGRISIIIWKLQCLIQSVITYLEIIFLLVTDVFSIFDRKQLWMFRHFINLVLIETPFLHLLYSPFKDTLKCLSPRFSWEQFSTNCEIKISHISRCSIIDVLLRPDMYDLLYCIFSVTFLQFLYLHQVSLSSLVRSGTVVTYEQRNDKDRV